MGIMQELRVIKDNLAALSAEFKFCGREQVIEFTQIIMEQAHETGKK